MADSPLLRRLKERAMSLGARTTSELLSSEHSAEAIGAAVRTMQGGRRALDEQGMRVAGALGLATQRDLERVERKLGRLRKRLLEILDRLDEP